MVQEFTRRGFLLLIAMMSASLVLSISLGMGRAEKTQAKRCVVVWSEGTAPKNIYPKDISGAIAEGLKELKDWEVVTANLSDPDQGLSDNLLKRTDVLIWWGHKKHDEVKDELVDKIVKRVKEDGMGFIALHSSHFAKPNKKLMGTACSWKAYVRDTTTLKVRINDPTHPIAQGIREFTVTHNERYSDPYAVPSPKAVVFEGTATLDKGGIDTSQQGLTWEVGKGKVFYFQPGHETNPIFYDHNIRKIMLNAVKWAASADKQTDMVYIYGGTFQMGDSFNEGYSDERPVHTVTLDSFYMGKYEVSNQQYCQYLNSALGRGLITVKSGVVYKAGSGTSYMYCDTSRKSPYSQIAYTGGVFSVRTKGGRNMSNDPMVMVSWYGAVAYCNWRSEQEGKEQCYDLSTWQCDFGKKGYRLPTEAEWEYVARGRLSGKRFPWGDTITHSQANYYSSNSHSYDASLTRGYHPTWNDGVYPYISPAGSFAANDFGVHDMSGNVWEWCNDRYSDTYYSSSPQNNPTGSTWGDSRVLRGGSWAHFPHDCRVSNRNYYPCGRNRHCGFRLSLDLN